MYLKIEAVVMIIVAALVVAIMPSASVQAAPEKTIKIRMVGTLPIGHHLTDALNLYKEYVEQKSNGRVVVELYPAQQLYNDKDLVNVIPKGSVDMAIANMDMWGGLIPTSGFFFMPFVFDNEDHFFRVFHGEAGDILRKELEKFKCKGLGAIQYGTSDLIFKKPMTTTKEAEGRRIRAYGQSTSYFLQSLGMAPTMMSSGEMYEGMAKGTIDGAISGLTTMKSRKLYEVAKYVPDVILQPVTLFMTIANLDFYNKMPQDVQKILSDGAIEIEKYTRKSALEETIEARKIMTENGVTFQKITDEELAQWKAKSTPFMISKFKENCDQKTVDAMLNSLEKERTK